jgi:branched-chain amino acid transport system ATP-binding protein
VARLRRPHRLRRAGDCGDRHAPDRPRRHRLCAREHGHLHRAHGARKHLVAARAGAPETRRLQWILGLFPALERFWNLSAGALSGGQKQMLALARAMIEPRKLLLIDEPTKGLAPAIIGNMIEAFRELKRTETTILLVEQNFRFASALGDRVAVMDDGRVVHAGDMGALAQDRDLQQRLLGLSLDSHQ